MKFKPQTFAFSNEVGVFTIEEVSSTTLKGTSLNGSKVEVSTSNPSLKTLKDFDPELSVPLELLSTSELRARRKTLMSTKSAKKKKKPAKKKQAEVERLTFEILKKAQSKNPNKTP